MTCLVIMKSKYLPVGNEEVDLCSITAAAELCKLKNCFGSETAFKPTSAAVLFWVSGSYEASIRDGQLPVL